MTSPLGSRQCSPVSYLPAIANFCITLLRCINQRSVGLEEYRSVSSKMFEILSTARKNQQCECLPLDIFPLKYLLLVIKTMEVDLLGYSTYTIMLWSCGT